jgi:hypothetical protein
MNRDAPLVGCKRCVRRFDGFCEGRPDHGQRHVVETPSYSNSACFNAPSKVHHAGRGSL